MILLQEYFIETDRSIDIIDVLSFFNDNTQQNYKNFVQWLDSKIPLEEKRTKILISNSNGFNWNNYKQEFINEINLLGKDVKENPIKYKRRNISNTAQSKDKQDNNVMLLDTLFTENFLPTYSFPRNVVNFWIEDQYGRIEESPERSIDIALSEYAPGRMIVVNKKSYISGVIYNHYTKYEKVQI